MLNQAVKESIETCVLCWLASADANGFPNVSPKEMFIADGDTHLLIAHIASPHSVKNIVANPQVCVSFVDVFKQKGYKLKGIAKIIGHDDAGYAERVQKIHARLGAEDFPIKSVIEITVTAVVAIVAPSYWLYPETTTEQGQIAQAMLAYGVRPRE